MLFLSRWRCFGPIETEEAIMIDDKIEPKVNDRLEQDDWFLQFRLKACVKFMPPLRRPPPAQ